MGLFGSVSYKKNLRRSLRDNYGRTPDPFYSAGDMATIRSYYDHMREHDPDTFRVDDVTWSDLDMDRVFKRINPGVSTPGEHWLYYMLRTPAMDAEEYARRERLIHFAEKNVREREETQFMLGCLGRFRRADVCSIFAPESSGYFTMVIYILLALSLLCSPLSLIWLGAKGLLITLALFALNVMLHEWNLRHCQAEMDTVNFSVSMAFTMRKLRRLGYAELDECLSEAYGSLARLRPLMALGSIPARRNPRFRPRRALPPARQFARAIRHGAAGYLAENRHHPRKHRLWPAGRHGGGNRLRRQGRARGRLHPAPAPGLRHHGVR